MQNGVNVNIVRIEQYGKMICKYILMLDIHVPKMQNGFKHYEKIICKYILMLDIQVPKMQNGFNVNIVRIEQYGKMICKYTLMLDIHVPNMQNVDLKKHMMLKHTNIQDLKWMFKCEYCSYRGMRRDRLKNHIIVKHINSKEAKWFQ
ncbi:hypothetical protein BDFB_004078 [Asbolus verrucosus]|uniref:C2H2-type domain-containing protein n=1 Tax=Asbolus verrucosus TaxID=1661398 RepID=A0A482W6W8_ASBVE|nr:hypothetical protein BDFB_004078 [Asbolus verrucosus]